MLHRAEEDYLKLIYELQVEAGKSLIKNGEIKEAFGFTDQSVSDMIKRLSEQKLVKYEPYKGVYLTKKGIEEAIKLVRAHRIWEVFLTKHLGYSWHMVHDEAENLEHASSEAMIENLYNYLDRPKTCIHGNPIPSSLDKPIILDDKSLFSAKKDNVFILTRVTDDPFLLKMLDEYKILLNDRFEIIEKDIHNEYFKINTKIGLITLTFASSKKIFGEVL